jgi:hypothetical protein
MNLCPSRQIKSPIAITEHCRLYYNGELAHDRWVSRQKRLQTQSFMTCLPEFSTWIDQIERQGSSLLIHHLAQIRMQPTMTAITFVDRASMATS